ncbi:MAG: hypothetical protein JWM19_5210 [Actinomycetia bacterium]|nr:hypothetical protein [Actinomycetes bacterium]
MSGRRGPGSKAVEVACALAEAFFATTDQNGQTVVSLDQAHLFAAGRVDLWDAWPTQLQPVKEIVGRFLRFRHNELAAKNAFLSAARRQFTASDAPYAVPGGVAFYEAAHVVSMHGQQPLEFATRLLDCMEEAQGDKRVLLPVAAAGRWTFGGGQAVSSVALPERPSVPADRMVPPVIVTAPGVAEVKITRQELEDLAGELDRASGGTPWRQGVATGLLAGLRDDEDLPVGELVARAGQLRLLNAPTGVGKTVLNRLIAIHLARMGIRTCLTVTNINDALNTEADIQADLKALSWQLGQRIPSCAALVSARRMHEKTLLAAESGDWERAGKLGYGCALKSYVIDGPLPSPGHEPCAELRQPPEPRAGGRPASKGSRHACPWRAGCGRYRLMREAVEADIVITYHHMLASGHVSYPVVLDGTEIEGISVLEFVMRACPVLLIDEIDQFQSTLVDIGTKEIKLAAKGRRSEELPLAQIEIQRDGLLPGADRVVLPPLMRTRFLAEQFLNYVLDGEIWLDDSEDRSGAGWHLPGTLDDFLVRALFGIAEDQDIADDVYRAYDSLFPDREERGRGATPQGLAQVSELILEAVSNDTGGDEIAVVKHRLHEQLEACVPDRGVRGKVVNGLLVRAWLGSLRQVLTRLIYAVSSPDVQLAGARELAEKLGVFVQHAAIPYGPLGYLLFGFRVTRDGDEGTTGELSVQAIAGDPHTTTAQLAGTVALAAAGHERVVVGLSATAFFPGAAREHVHVPVTWAMTDAAPGGVKATSGQVLGKEMKPIQIAGMREADKEPELEELGRRLWSERLEPFLDAAQADGRRDRARALIVGNSYRQCARLARGIGELADPRRLSVAVSTGTGGTRIPLPPGAQTLTADQFESFGHGRPGRVLIAPLSRVARGLNILVPGQQISAIASIWVCVRPVGQVHEPSELFASFNSVATGTGRPSADPAAGLDAQRRAAHNRLYRILRSDQRFSLLPRDLKAEVVAGMLVDFIQLAGRARRGGTPVELYLVDGAFHDPHLSSDLGSLLRYHYQSLSKTERAAMHRIYGSMLTALLDFAQVPPKTQGS